MRWAHSARVSQVFSAVRPPPPLSPFSKTKKNSRASGGGCAYIAYQQPVRYNLSVAREVLKYVYTAERLQPPTSLGAVLGTYGTLWSSATSIAHWRRVVTSGEWARLGVYAVEAYGIFKVTALLLPLALFVLMFFRLGRLLGVGRSLAITCSRLDARCTGLPNLQNG